MHGPCRPNSSQKRSQLGHSSQKFTFQMRNVCGAEVGVTVVRSEKVRPKWTLAADSLVARETGWCGRRATSGSRGTRPRSPRSPLSCRPMSLTREQVLERTTEVLKKHAKGEVQLSEKTEIVADLGIDSLGVMEALAEVEDALEVTFDDEQLQGISTLGDLVDLIARLVAPGD